MTDGEAPAKASDDVTASAAELEALLAYVRDSRGFDFSGYKRASLERRISKRVAAMGHSSYADYQDYLEANPREFAELFNTVLINVTRFFREPAAWEYVAMQVVPELLAHSSSDEPIRVWSAGCASGEEAYTIAMILAEAMGEDAFRDRVKIYATDIDEDALAIARHARYPEDGLKELPKGFAERYFAENSGGLTFRTDLRRSVIFGRNDLTQDAPISHIDLLISRNVLIYFVPDTQARVLRQFNFALRETGFLFLGRSELLTSHAELFVPRDVKGRVFQKVVRPGIRDRLSFVADPARMDPESAHQPSDLGGAAAELAPVPQLVVGGGGTLAWANRAARELFGLRTADLGRPLQDLEVSYRPADIRSGLDQVRDSGGPIELGRRNWRSPRGHEHVLEITVTPLGASGDQPPGATVTFVDVTDVARLGERHQEAQRRLESAYEELQSTGEELETTNEELQSTNEELETTNEELQSSNEELETMNEELQSTNDELEAMNEEHREHARELDRLNLFLEGILGGLGIGVVVLDHDRRVQLWNASSQDLWGLRHEEVEGEPFRSLDIGLPVKELDDPIGAALDSGEQSTVAVEALNRRGRRFECRVRVLPLTTPEGETYGAIMLMSESGSDGASG